MPDRGRFITLEGIEGVGKSTHVEHVCNLLTDAGLEVVRTREPGGTSLGEGIRALLLDRKQTGMTPDSELLLMFAARAEHLRRVILPALEAGKCVVSDRFTDATYAYQGGGRGIGAQRIAALESWVQGDLRPSLTLLLDTNVETALARSRKRAPADRFEQESVAFFTRVRECYLRMAREHTERYRIIDATPPIADVQAKLERVLKAYLARILHQGAS